MSISVPTTSSFRGTVPTPEWHGCEQFARVITWQCKRSAGEVGEPATSQVLVQHSNHYITEPHKPSKKLRTAKSQKWLKTYLTASTCGAHFPPFSVVSAAPPQLPLVLSISSSVELLIQLQWQNTTWSENIPKQTITKCCKLPNKCYTAGLQCELHRS